MKYKSNTKVWYVNPFVFEIDELTIQMGYIGEDGFIYYIDEETGAELAEHDLFRTCEEAKKHSIYLLNKFYNERVMYLNAIKDNIN